MRTFSQIRISAGLVKQIKWYKIPFLLNRRWHLLPLFLSNKPDTVFIV
jgi:hypothetical protein